MCHCHKGLSSDADFIHQDTEQRWQGERQPQVIKKSIHDADKKIPFAADSIWEQKNEKESLTATGWKRQSFRLTKCCIPAYPHLACQKNAHDQQVGQQAWLLVLFTSLARAIPATLPDSYVGLLSAEMARVVNFNKYNDMLLHCTFKSLVAI